MPNPSKGTHLTPSKEATQTQTSSVQLSPTKSKKSSNLLFFSPQEYSPEQLKQKAKPLFFQRKRQKFTYQENHTASLALQVRSDQLNPSTQSNAELLLLAQKNIIEHATMRVDLFFYTLIAYYKKNLHPTAGPTYLQHGRGRSSGDFLLSEACHNSILPSLLDETILIDHPQKPKACLLSGTHFMNNLNSTTELPPFVNDIDDFLEQLSREKSLQILQAVSLGRIDPIEGLTLFLQLLKTSLDCLNQKALKGKNFFVTELIELIVEGSLTHCFDDETETVKEEYVQLLMYLNIKEKKSCLNKQQKAKVYQEKFMKIQTQILSAEVALPVSPAHTMP